MKEVRLNFYGYTWEEYAFQISSLKGIFIVYSGKLTRDGEIALNDVLYIGYHTGIFELYEQGIFDNIKGLVPKEGRIFLSYAEVPTGTNPDDIVGFMKKAVSPMYIADVSPCSERIKIISTGNCALIPKEITNVVDNK